MTERSPYDEASSNKGLHLPLVRGLAERRATITGFEYAARDTAGSIIASLVTEYSQELCSRAQWVTSTFAQRDLNSLNAFFNERFGHFGEEFALTSPGWEDHP